MQMHTDVGSVYGVMATGGETASASDETGVIGFADDDLPGAQLDLGMALEAKVIVCLEEHFGIRGAMRNMADGAAFAHRFMVVDKRPGLLPVTFGAGFVDLGHGQAAGGLSDVTSMGIMAVRATHAVLDHGVMLGQMEFRLDIEVATKTSFRIILGVDNKTTFPTPCRDMFAAGAMAGFAACLASPFEIVLVELAVRAGVENSRDVRMTFDAGAIADKRGPFNFRRSNDCAIECGAGTQEQTCQTQRSQNRSNAGPALDKVRHALGEVVTGWSNRVGDG